MIEIKILKLHYLQHEREYKIFHVHLLGYNQKSTRFENLFECHPFHILNFKCKSSPCCIDKVNPQGSIIIPAKQKTIDGAYFIKEKWNLDIIMLICKTLITIHPVQMTCLLHRFIMLVIEMQLLKYVLNVHEYFWYTILGILRPLFFCALLIKSNLIITGNLLEIQNVIPYIFV